jgi:hypothetical protein
MISEKEEDEFRKSYTYTDRLISKRQKSYERGIDDEKNRI